MAKSTGVDAHPSSARARPSCFTISSNKAGIRLLSPLSCPPSSVWGICDSDSITQCAVDGGGSKFRLRKSGFRPRDTLAACRGTKGTLNHVDPKLRGRRRRSGVSELQMLERGSRDLPQQAPSLHGLAGPPARTTPAIQSNESTAESGPSGISKPVGAQHEAENLPAEPTEARALRTHRHARTER